MLYAREYETNKISSTCPIQTLADTMRTTFKRLALGPVLDLPDFLLVMPGFAFGQPGSLDTNMLVSAHVWGSKLKPTLIISMLKKLVTSD